ncbi:MAG: prolipoprotein diacylglyceryl transferase [Clostridiales bacterium]|nr:prolipoprotein diacylglyceryl transferase [Clostridiales bacterium]
MFATPSSRLIFGLLPWYSVLIVTGICLALLIASREEKRLSLPKDTVVDMALWIIPFGVIGARLYYVAFSWETFAGDPLSILYVWEGGLAIYGGVLGGLLAAFLFARRRKIPLGTLTDIITPGLALAQAVGRWGNYFNMEAYGAQIIDPAWQFFPAAVFIPNGNGGAWHMATFFYESMWNLGVFATLMLIRRRMRRPGDTTLWYFLLYGAGRLVIEGLRTDSLYAGSGTIRISQVLAIVMGLGVAGIFFWRTLRSQGLRRLMRPSSLPMLGCVALCIGLAVYLNASGFGGIEASTLQCAALSLMLIVSGATLYAAHQS